MIDTKLQIQESEISPNTHIQSAKIKDREKLERNWRKNIPTYGGARIRITQDFSEIMEARRVCSEIEKILSTWNYS